MSTSVPLRERRRDWFFVVVFAMFASTSFLIDTAQLVSRPSPDAGYVMARFVYDGYGSTIDPLVVANPRFVQIGVGVISALVFGVFYLVLIYAFVRGRNWIRVPAIFFAGMVTQGTLIYVGVGLLGDAPLFDRVCDGACAGFDYKFTNAAIALAFNVPYIVVALLLVARMWRAEPFSRR
jgi:EXPERA (EXPanded EBP superfamily)